MPTVKKVGVRITQRTAKKTLKIMTLREGHVFHDTLLLHACFQVLVDFVNSIGPVELAASDNPKAVEILHMYHYWTLDRPKMIHDEDVAREIGDRCTVAELETTRKSTDSEYLQRLIDIRPYLCPSDQLQLLVFQESPCI